jgi:probable HAF family extracellular repeat protein
VPLSTDGALIGAADTATLDSDYPNCAPPGGCSDPYVQHAFTFQDGRLTDLGALPGQNISAIYELNIYGVGAGSSEDGLVDPNTGKAAQVAVLFDHGQVTDLGTLAGGDESFAQDIDDQGQVAGFSSNGTPDPYSFFGWGTETRTFVWRNGVMTDLGTLGGNDTVLQAQNQRGQIAGWSYTNDTPSPYTGVPTTDPFLWEDGHMIDLGTLGGDYGVVNWLNDSGEVVGWSQLAGDPGGHAFAWDGGRMVDLGTLGGALSSANWVSDNGDIAGTAQLPNGAWNGVLWRAGKTIDLPPVDGAPWSSANAVNDGGEVVGNVTDTSSDELDGVLWTGGVAYDLNTLVAPSPLHLASGEYINDQGDIVGMGMLSNGDQRIFEMVPNYSVPLPGVPTPRPLPSTGLPCEASWSWAHHPW